MPRTFTNAAGKTITITSPEEKEKQKKLQNAFGETAAKTAGGKYFEQRTGKSSTSETKKSSSGGGANKSSGGGANKSSGGQAFSAVKKFAPTPIKTYSASAPSAGGGSAARSAMNNTAGGGKINTAQGNGRRETSASSFAAPKALQNQRKFTPTFGTLQSRGKPGRTDVQKTAFEAAKNTAPKDLRERSVREDAENYKTSNAASAGSYVKRIERETKSVAYAYDVARNMVENGDMTKAQFKRIYGKYERQRAAGKPTEPTAGEKIKEGFENIGNALSGQTRDENLRERQAYIERLTSANKSMSLEKAREYADERYGTVEDIKAGNGKTTRENKSQTLYNEQLDKYHENVFNEALEGLAATKRRYIYGEDGVRENNIYRADDGRVHDMRWTRQKELQDEAKVKAEDFEKYHLLGSKDKDNIINKTLSEVTNIRRGENGNITADRKDANVYKENRLGDASISEENSRALNMTDDEKAQYLYILGAYGKDAARAYFDKISPYIDKRMAQAQMTRMQDISDKHKVLGAGINIVAGLSGGVKPTVTEAATAAKDFLTSRHTIENPYQEAFLARQVQAATREGITRDMGTAGRTAADILLSAGNSAASHLFGPLGLLNMGLNAAANTVYEKELQGIPRGDAMKYGIVAGAIEYGTEKLPFDTVNDMFSKSLSKTAANEIFKSVILTAGSEAGEEAVGNIANNLAEIWILKDKSEYEQYITALMAQGMSREDATKEAFKKFMVSDTVTAALTGAASGGLMGGAALSVNGIANTYDNIAAGRDIKRQGADAVQSVIDAGLRQGAGTDAYRSARATNDKMQNTERRFVPSAYRVGRQENMNNRAIADEALRAAWQTARTGYDVNYRDDMETWNAGNTVNADGAKYSVRTDDNGNAYVNIDEDILDGVPEKDWVKTVRNVLRNKFKQGIEYNGENVSVSAKSRGEFTRSPYTDNMKKSERADKFRMANNLDEIIDTQSNVNSEIPTHTRGDDIVGFERGNTRVTVGNHEFTADVLLANKKDGTKQFYDVINLSPTKIQHTANMSRDNANIMDRGDAVSSDNSISNDNGNVNTNYSVDTETAEENVPNGNKKFVPRREININANKAQTVDTLEHEAGHVTENLAGEQARAAINKTLEVLMKPEYAEQLNNRLDALKRSYDAQGIEYADEKLLNDIAVDMRRGGLLYRTSADYERATREGNYNRRMFIPNAVRRATSNVRSVFGGTVANENAGITVSAKDANTIREAWERADNAAAQAYRAGNANTANSGTRYSFAGENARTADTAALARARKMEKNGATAEEIWRETGWGRGLDGEWRFEIDDGGMKYDRRGDVKGVQLENYIKHDELFKNYPYLKNVHIRFDDIAGAAQGYYDRSGTVVLSNNMRNAPEDTLIHEIQHIIQEDEGFARGANPEYWAARDEYADAPEREYMQKVKSLTEEQQRLWWQYQEYERVLDDLFLKDGSESEYAKYENRQDKLYVKLYPEQWFKDMLDADRKRHDTQGYYYNLYENTAGEIEARDAASRRNMTAQERRNTFPESMNHNEDVVFADGGVSYAQNPTDSETMAIKEQIRANLDELNKMDTVATAEVDTNLSKDDIRRDVLQKYSELGFEVTRDNFGVIEIGKKQINGSLSYLSTQEERAALLTVPDVLKNGVEISNRQNHKGRYYNTYTFAAPVEINGARGVQGVVVKKTSGNKYKTHRILMPDGSAFTFSDNKTEASINGLTSVSEGDSPSITSVNNSISNPDGNVNTDFSVDTSAEQDSHKQRQLDIILNVNPALNDYSAWIRTADDIRTFEETLSDDDWEEGEDFDPDYTYDMALEAVDTGKITVYSSYPIEQGIFVTPSRMEAESYSGDGRIYSRVVNLKDVAWIDPTQGQYAKVDNTDIRYSVDTNAEKPKSAAARIVDEYGVRGRVKIKDLNEKLRELSADVYDTYYGGGDTSAKYEQLENKARQIAEEIAGEMRRDNTELREEYNRLRREIKNTRININEIAKSDIPDWNDYRKRNFGYFTIAKDGIALDSFYKELTEQYPQYFDETKQTAQSDQLQTIVDTLESLRPAEYALSESEYNEAVESLTNKLISDAGNMIKQEQARARRAENKRRKKELRYTQAEMEELLARQRQKIEERQQRRQERRAEEREERQATAEYQQEVKELIDEEQKKRDAAREAREIEEYMNDDTLLDAYNEDSVSMTDRRKFDRAQFIPRVKRWGRRFIAAQSDKLYPIKSYERFAENQIHGEEKVKFRGKSSPYVMASNSIDAQSRAKYILTEKLTDFDANEIGESLADIVGDLSYEDYRDFNTYLKLRHGIEWVTNKTDYKPVFGNEWKNDPSAMKAAIRRLDEKHPDFYAAAKRAYEYQDKMMKAWLVDTGVISKDMYDALRKKYPEYVPFFRQDETPARGQGKNGLANQNNPVKEAEGGSQPIYDPIESIMINTSKFVNAAAKNSAMQAAVNIYDTTPGMEEFMAEVVKHPETGKYVLKKSKAGKAIQAEAETAPETVEEFEEYITDAVEHAVKLTDGDIVSVLENGEKRYLKVFDKELLTALDNLHPIQVDPIMRAVASATRIFSALATNGNPMFTLASNPIKDAQNAFAQTIRKNPFGVIKGIADAQIEQVKNSGFAKKRGSGGTKAYKKYMAMGGEYASAFSAGRNAIKETLDEIKPDRGGAAAKVGRAVKFVPRTYGKVADAIETAPRLSEFKYSLNEAGNDVHQAHFDSKNVTLNFGRSGYVGEKINKFAPFYNPSVQGIAMMIRNFKNKPLQTSLRVATLTAISALALLWNGKDEKDREEYNNASSYLKNNYYLFHLGDGKFFKAPKSQEYGVIPSLLERAVEKYAYDNPDAFYDYADYISTAMLPSIFKAEFPFVDTGSIIGLGTYTSLLENKDFKGAPIVPDYLQDETPEKQYDDRTSYIARFIGDKLKWSPMKIDYAINSNTGFLGKINESIGHPGEKDYLLGMKTKFRADSLFNTDQINIFYENKDSAEKTVNSYPSAEHEYLSKRFEQSTGVLKLINELYKEYSAQDGADSEKLAREVRRSYVNYARDNKKNPTGLSDEIYEKLKDLYDADSSVLTLPSISSRKIEAKIDDEKQSYTFTTADGIINYQKDLNKGVDKAYRDLMGTVEYGAMSDVDRIEALEQAKNDAIGNVKQFYIKNKAQKRMFDDEDLGAVPSPSAEEVKTYEQELERRAAQTQAANERRDRLHGVFQSVADNAAKVVEPERAKKYSVEVFENGIKNLVSKTIDDKKYKIYGETEAKMIAEANEEFYTNIEKLENNEINVEDVIGYTDKGKIQRSKDSSGQWVSKSGKMYNEDGTDRFDPIVKAMIYYGAMDKAKEHAIEKYEDEMIADNEGAERSEGTTSEPSPTPNTQARSSGGYTQARGYGGKSSGGSRRSSGGGSGRSSGSSSGTSARRFVPSAAAVEQETAAARKFVPQSRQNAATAIQQESTPMFTPTFGTLASKGMGGNAARRLGTLRKMSAFGRA